MKRQIHINKSLQSGYRNERLRKKTFTKPFNRNAPYNEIHTVAVEYFENVQVPIFVGS